MKILIDKPSPFTEAILIFYTLKGPGHELEIYEDKIRMVKKPWFFQKPQFHDWQIRELSQFEITVPKFMMISGKIQWTTFDGKTGTFRFSTTPAMVKKIETYLQKRVIKNHQALHETKVKELPFPKRNKKERQERAAA